MASDFQTLRAYQDSLIDHGIAGNDLAIYVGYNEVYRHMAGFRILEEKSPITKDTIFQMFSMTKPITATAAMQLWEQGKFQLNDKLSEYLPEFGDMTVRTTKDDGTVSVVKAKEPIRIAHLFEMTAGFDYRTDTPSFREMMERTGGNHTLEDFVLAMSKEPLNFEPGTHWLYSLAHDVLARLVEVVSGMKFSEYLRKNLFDPLGMHDTLHHKCEVPAERLAGTYDQDGSGLMRICGPLDIPIFMGPKFDAGGLGLCMTVDDYARFATAMTHFGVSKEGERILAKRTVELMRTNRLNHELMMEHWRSGKTRVGYGWGLGMRTMVDQAAACSASSIGEFGWSGALGTYVLMDPAADLTVVLGIQTPSGERRHAVQLAVRTLTYAALEYEGLI